MSRPNTPTFKQGFTLLEVLIAGAVLFLVASAVIGLNNSILQGTSINADQTSTSAWAAEGLELASKIRDDTARLHQNFVNGDPIWFSPAYSTSLYGWYRLEQTGTPANPSWQLAQIQPNPGAEINLDDLNNNIIDTGAPLTANGITAYRLICIESYAAVDTAPAGKSRCNADANGALIASDGSRTSVSSCDTQYDLYCNYTKSSLNKNKLSTLQNNFIPAGNAVKIRSMVAWQDRGQFRTYDISSLLTNNISLTQLNN